MSDVPQPLPDPNPSGQAISPEQSLPIDPASLARHYEQDDVDVRAILRFGAAIAGGMVVAAVGLWLVLQSWTEARLPIQMQLPPAAVTVPAAPGPGLDAAPEENLQRTLQVDDELLSTYGWIDREAEIVHIPIDRAMILLAEGNVTTREGEAPNFGLAPAFRLDSSGGVAPAGSDGEDEEAGDE